MLVRNHDCVKQWRDARLQKYVLQVDVCYRVGEARHLRFFHILENFDSDLPLADHDAYFGTLLLIHQRHCQ